MKAKTKHLVRILLERIHSGELFVKDGELYRTNNGALVGGKDKLGYRVVTITFEGKRRSVKLHRVLYAYYHGINALDDDLVINHLDGNPANNRGENLEQVTNGQNIKHYYNLRLKNGEDGPLGHHHKITKEEAALAKKLLENGETISDVARHFNVDVGSIKHIETGKSFSYVDTKDVPLLKIERMDFKPKIFYGEEHGKSKLTEDIVREIRLRHSNGESTRTLAKEFNIGKSNVWSIVARKTWDHV